jgi:hypothetical protein
MKTGTVHTHHRNPLPPRTKGSPASTHSHLKTDRARSDASIRLAPSDVRATARNLRELLLWDLREEGYTFRELGELFGMTKQRVSQIERKMILRTTGRALKGRPPTSLVCELPRVRLRAITSEQFDARLNSINRFYQEQFNRIVERGYKRQRRSKQRSGAQATSEFWRVWPFIEAYQKQPFSFSKLLSDFPQLFYEPHLAQHLSRLRRTGLLQKVGMVKVKGRVRPEVLMAEAPVEQHVTAAIERLVARWSEKLRRLELTRRPYRPNRSIELTRQWLIHRLITEGIPRSQIDEIFHSDPALAR